MLRKLLSNCDRGVNSLLRFDSPAGCMVVYAVDRGRRTMGFAGGAFLCRIRTQLKSACNFRSGMTLPTSGRDVSSAQIVNAIPESHAAAGRRPCRS